jgi:hypothetical protein
MAVTCPLGCAPVPSIQPIFAAIMLRRLGVAMLMLLAFLTPALAMAQSRLAPPTHRAT